MSPHRSDAAFRRGKRLELRVKMLKTISSWPVIATLAWMALALSRAAAEERTAWPGAEWEQASPAEARLREVLLQEARDYALTGKGSGYIVRGGRLVISWGDPRKRYDLKSTTKSIGATALGVAMQDGKLRLEDLAHRHHPSFGVPPQSNQQTGWLQQITILQLATHTAGFEKPGGYTPLIFQPGTKWAYSDGGPNWLAECLTYVYQRDLAEWMFERVFTPLGIRETDLTWRRNAYRPAQLGNVARREFGSGVSANVDAMARLGYLYLREGRWRDQQILPAEFVRQAGRPLAQVKGLPVVDPQTYGDASNHYGLLWWNNWDQTLAGVPRDAYWSWGLHDSLIVVMPSLDIVVARAGESWHRGDEFAHYEVLRPFLEPIAAAAAEP